MRSMLALSTVVIALAAASSSSSGAVIRLDFSGVIDSVNGTPPVTAAAGDLYQGSITYDTTSPGVAETGGSFYRSTQSFSAVIHHAGGDATIVPDHLNDDVPNPVFPAFGTAPMGQEAVVLGTQARYSFSTYTALYPSGSDAPIGVNFSLYSFVGGTAPSGTNLPTSLPVSLIDFNYSLTGLSIFKGGANFITGHPTSFTFTTVPAPGTIAMFAGSTLLLRRRRR